MLSVVDLMSDCSLEVSVENRDKLDGVKGYWFWYTLDSFLGRDEEEGIINISLIRD